MYSWRHLILVKNKPRDGYNAQKLNQSNYFEFKIEVIDGFLDAMLIHLQTSLFSRSCRVTAGLSWYLKLKKGLCIMIVSNVDITDGLINDQFGIVCHFGYIDSSITRCIWNWIIGKQVERPSRKVHIHHNIKLYQLY